jgi:Ni/Fe-hydrogenase subunit HybB-like protein
VPASTWCCPFFRIGTALISGIALILGIRSLMENDAKIETAPTTSIFIPVLSTISILSLRQKHGFDVHFALISQGPDRLVML